MCQDAQGLLEDGSTCELAGLLASWVGHGHEERAFERHPSFLIVASSRNKKKVEVVYPIKVSGIRIHCHSLHQFKFQV